MFSWAVVFISDRRSRMPTNSGRTFWEYILVISMSSGVTATSSSVSFQLMVKKRMRVEANITTLSTTV